MKHLNDLNQALTYHLEGMYDAEKKLQKILPELLEDTNSDELKSEMSSVLLHVNDTRIKLKRIFSYLLSGPYRRKNKVIDQLLKEAILSPKITSTPELTDVRLLSVLHAVVSYQISVYRSAKFIAAVLDLDTVVDQLDEIIAWREQTDRALTKMTSTISVKARGQVSI
jgi:ferritin-like metal-binding protein YciE